MAESLAALAKYLEAVKGSKSKIIVWAHKTHQGDAQMTKIGESGEFNVGHLMRQAHGGDSFLVGFTTYTGEVIVASDWGEEGRGMQLRPSL